MIMAINLTKALGLSVAEFYALYFVGSILAGLGVGLLATAIISKLN